MVGPSNLSIYFKTVRPYSYFDTHTLELLISLSPAFKHRQSFHFPYIVSSLSFFFSRPFSSSFSFMAFFLIFLLTLIVPSSNAAWPPSPGYWPSTKFRSMSFYKGFRNLWGPSHQRAEKNALTIWLDSTSGLFHFHFVLILIQIVPLLNFLVGIYKFSFLLKGLIFLCHNRKWVQISSTISIRLLWCLY